MVDKGTSLTNEQEVEFDRAFEMLGELVDLQDANEYYPHRANAVYTSCVILWMLIYQRLHPDPSLEVAVKHLIDTRPSYLPDNKRIREGRLSLSTAAYSSARSELPLDVVQWFCKRVSDSIVAQSKPLLDDRQIFLLDGTTIALAPEKELQQAYPPASNQHGEGTWPIALLCVFHELASGCALLPEIGAMYGPDAVSETELAQRGMACLPSGSVVMADAGMGIFGVAWHAHRFGHDFLLRMKKVNFESLRKKATLVDEGKNHKSYQHTWVPTAHNLKTNPHLPADASLSVQLHEVTVSDRLTLYFVTTLEHNASTLSKLFQHRVHVEIDIRNLKVVLDTENIRAKKKDTFLKELYTSVVAYNLVSQLRRQAAELNDLPPRRMSFKRTWTTFQIFLLRSMHTDPSAWRAAYDRALHYAKQDKLPNRPHRTAKREAYRKRPKDQQFEKREKPPSKIKLSDLK